MLGSRLSRSMFVVAVAVAAGAAVAAPAVGATATKSSSESACTLTSTGGTVTRWLPSTRSYNLRVPSGLSNPAPLLLSIHGFSSFPYGQEQASGWSPYADQKKFIVAYPAGEWNTWNLQKGSPDVKFLRDVVDHIAAKYCVDPKRVYAEGGSYGSWMAQRLGCDAADKFAAVSGFMGGSPNSYGGCTPSRPVGVSLFHGESDPLINISQGKRSRDEWVARNGCNPAPIVEPVPSGTAQSYSGCSGGVTVTWRSYAGLGHEYPKGADGADFRNRAWKHLTSHTLP
jgi:polyhydroxybutyrate depolymerase